MKIIITVLLTAVLLAPSVAADEPDIDSIEFYHFITGLPAEFIKGLPEKQAIKIVPTETNSLLRPPEEWKTVTIDSLSLQLPLSKFETASHFFINAIRFRSKDFGMSLFQLGPMREDLHYPAVSFALMCSVYRVSPKDLSSAVTEEKRMLVLSRMLTKSMCGDGLKEIVIVKTPKLNSMIMRFRKPEGKPSSTFLHVWHPGGRIHFEISIVNEPSPDYALRVLGGIRFTGDRIDTRKVSADLDRICRGFKSGGNRVTPLEEDVKRQ